MGRGRAVARGARRNFRRHTRPGGRRGRELDLDSARRGMVRAQHATTARGLPPGAGAARRPVPCAVYLAPDAVLRAAYRNARAARDFQSAQAVGISLLPVLMSPDRQHARYVAIVVAVAVVVLLPVLALNYTLGVRSFGGGTVAVDASRWAEGAGGGAEAAAPGGP